MRSTIIVAAAAIGLLAGCSSDHPNSSPAAVGTTGSSNASASRPTNDTACNGGLNGGEDGVVSITCAGPAELKVTVNGSTTDLHGGTCQSGGGVWSATVGVLLDETGMQGTYSGPPVDDITVNDTADGKATVQVTIGDKHYFALGTASLKLSADQKSAHIDGTTDHLSDAPGTPIVVDVTC
jgi:hypothetical protein